MSRQLSRNSHEAGITTIKNQVMEKMKMSSRIWKMLRFAWKGQQIKDKLEQH